MDDCSRRIDLHMHTTVSDGTDDPGEILEKVRAAGIGVFSVTDHDSAKAASQIRPLIGEGDPFFVPGIEFSCADEEGKYHILGYGFDPAGEAIQRVIGFGHSLRMKKVRARVEFLRTQYGFDLPESETETLLSLDNPGKPHLGNLLVKYGYAKTMKQAIGDYINKLRLPDEHVGPETAIAGILASGGVPVLAHPFYGSGEELILGDDMDRRLRKLIGFGLRGLEAFYSGFSAKLTAGALELADRYDLFVTAGSDYHGSNKMVELGDTGLDAAAELPDGLRRFLEHFHYEAR